MNVRMGVVYPVTLLLPALLAGCSGVWSVDPVMLKEPLGASVKHMLVAQYYDPVAAAYPDPEPVTRLDGYRANNALQAYRLTTGQQTHLTVPNYSLSVGGLGGAQGGGGGQ